MRAGFVPRRHGQRQQQIFGGDEAVAGLLGRLFGGVEQPRGFARQIDLARTAFDLGQFRQRRVPRPGARLRRCRRRP